ncbi:DUF4240 domain-containing protein [Nocardia sp. MDA0666]|uniref:DUF4240 domain-containing protein n=1 Tax=Nocardia sp. MDA0666 TaxID=2135448 RepID=UPI001304987F|nr:DUF4240 domain-containing protein [Nocardia sp. MDA0666]
MFHADAAEPRIHAPHFDILLSDACIALDSAELAERARQIYGGPVHDDLFNDFKLWIIGSGRDTFARVLGDPARRRRFRVSGRRKTIQIRHGKKWVTSPITHFCASTGWTTRRTMTGGGTWMRNSTMW